MVALDIQALRVFLFCGVAGGVASLALGHGSLFDGVRESLRRMLACAKAEAETRRGFKTRLRVWICGKLNGFAQCPFCINHWVALLVVAVLTSCLTTVLSIEGDVGAFSWWFFKAVEIFVLVFVGAISYGLLRLLENGVSLIRGWTALIRVRAAREFIALQRSERLLEEQIGAFAKPSERIRGKRCSAEPAPYDNCTR